MADATKYIPIGGGNVVTDLRSLFSILKPRKTVAFAYVFMLVFIAFTVFLAFSPSPNASSPWFTNIFSSSSSATTATTTTTGSSKSQLSSIFSYFFPNSPSSSPNPSPSQSNSSRSSNAPSPSPNPKTSTETLAATASQNQTQRSVNSTRDAVSAPSTNQTTISNSNSPVASLPVKNQTTSVADAAAPASSVPVAYPPPLKPHQNLSSDSPGKGVAVSKNYTASLARKKSDGNREREELMQSLMKCDFFHGEWVRDESYPLYEPGSCSMIIDEQFNCIRNGRPDKDYQKYKWQPKDCKLPRLDGHRMLDLLRGKRLVFVGDSLNRNMWESLICILRNAVKDKSKVYEANGRVHFRGEASYSFIFKDYNFTVELFVSPFLVQEWEMPDKNGTKKETLRLDLVGRSSSQYKDADIIVFNTGHWWTHDKTSKGKDYYQEGSHVYEELNVLEAFRKAITTWSRWVDANVNPSKSIVLFRGYSASHFSGGQWNSGGQCDHETVPIDNEKYLTEYPPKMRVLEKVLKNMKTHVTYLNITRLTDFRKDGHPSMYRKLNLSPEEMKSPLMFQDCSHWCLPGVPDAWNEILYAELLIREYQNQKQNQQKRP
ncbi:protein trichome birefringence [Lotus japonicus]|uniref:protein trichome birefringence n=1 Tax=Lotus japonicus TaxID=34305 RepID=UPI0025900FC2|nr:protein trichome birefringence [Lotus japonicus]